ncbi:hypothetical protein GJ698_17385 [Pseudoduganella sp. FT26W]|uniref:Uncharacterized protein n=1 Tax=Duganella aquatilis TaxID=2666082 RepID=A0A844DDN3_9BURK|nr:hypothetical protein [Duganella aquatilis]MRW85849.1 hypothetical protein [Duganella aquatilis]
MAADDRRTRPSEALAVDNAIWLMGKEGTASAIHYLGVKGISHDVAVRALNNPLLRRRHRERRKSRRQ